MRHFCFRMTGFYIVALVAISLSIAGCFGGGTSSKSYTVSGKVVDGNGDGIVGAKIVVTGGKSTTTITENGGKYTLAGLTGICTLTPIFNGYTFEPNNLAISKASTNADFAGTMTPIETDPNPLIVRNGIGSGEYAEGATVNISADAPEESGKVFDKWTTSAGGSFADVNAETTSFTMPNNAVTVTATYRDATMADYFEFDSSTGTITKYQAKGKHNNLDEELDPEIPSSINGKAVTTIGKEAFQHAQITSVVIPDGVTTIEEWAFNNNLLASVDIPESVTTIGEYAFTANRLTSITIPDGITTIARGAFWLNKLTSVTIPNSVTHIGNSAFLSNELQNITIPDSVRDIGGSAFGFNYLVAVRIPGGVCTIGNSAFGNNPEPNHGNPTLTSVEIPDNVSLGDYTFERGINITTITIGSNVTLGSNLLDYNDNFKNAYYDPEGGEGIYHRVGGDWVKQ
ncbi:MAG: leucine-rich repeat protein [Firmicutes bacterium]|nr:leucine-rich repeat protein [Bacillota bacterium]